VTEAVVDGLEVVEVDEDQGDEPVAAPAERVLEAVVEQRPVRQARELVVEGAVAQLLLEGATFVDVAHGDDERLDMLLVEEVGRDALDVAP
jgi:hypothetical protein